MKEGQWPFGLQGGICIHDEVLSPKLCRNIIKFFHKRPHLQFPGRTFGGHSPDIKLSTDSYLTPSTPELRDDKERDKVRKYEVAVYEAYSKALKEYILSYDSLTNQWVSRKDTGYQYQRYEKGVGKYESHIDGAPFILPPSNHRVLASVMYLNTVEVGGGTRFDYFDYTCDAVEGRIVTFPATFLHLHGGLVPESSDKSIISTFVEHST